MAKRKRSAAAGVEAEAPPTIEEHTLPPPVPSRAQRKKAETVAKIIDVVQEPAEEIAATPTPKKARRSKKENPTAQVAETNAELVKEEIPPTEPLEALEETVGDDADEEEIKEALARPPPVNSDYLPLPWKGRLGYACLNTYLRNANPPVFSSRTCRIASILEHRHPLQDPSQPHHATKNRPDLDQPADVARGQKYVEALGIANAKDIVKMLLWNDKYGIKFLRLSSEMFPFASHAEYGYKLAPFVSKELEEAGKVAARLGHRLTTHPGQFTQLGSPRQEVIVSSIRDLEYHSELLSLLKLPPQQNRDAVMILHMGGIFGDKQATLQRFRDNYAGLSQDVKNRIVLENDDVCWTVHDLLPICEELNIPMVLDYHHHNILFDKDKIREGTKDIIDLYPRIKATWTRKNITQKMHYSEPCPSAITGRERRKHSPRVMTLPPCADDMDLMIEAKDKEQAVFELMRTFKLPGWNTFADILPHVREDEPKKLRGKVVEPEKEIPFEELNMGGPDGRVYWPPTMEEWLRPAKRIVKKKDASDSATPKKESKTPEKKTKAATPKKAATPGSAKKRKSAKSVPTPSTSDDDEVHDDDMDELATPVARKASARSRGRKVDYAEKGAESE